MRQLRERLPLAQHRLARGLAAHVHELDRHAAFELGIPRTPHDAHAAGARALQQVVPADRHAFGRREQRIRDPRARDLEHQRVVLRPRAQDGRVGRVRRAGLVGIQLVRGHAGPA